MKRYISKIKSFVPVLFFAFPFFASAHVGYVIPHEKFVENEGGDLDFFMNGISENIEHLIYAGIITLTILGLILFIRNLAPVKARIKNAVSKLETYNELLPWIARLGLGIALIGAGTAEVFLSPVSVGVTNFAFLEVVLGFLFLLGFLITPASIVAIGLFVYGIFNNSYLLGNLDFVALALALLLLGSGRPGLDDILSMPNFKSLKHHKFVPLALRIGLGVAFFYLGMYEKFLNPHDSELVVNTFNLMNVIPVAPVLWVLGAGIVECLLGILLILGFETRLVAVISFVVISLSFFYFKESVYSHVTLFAALSMLVVTGAGKYSVDASRSLEAKG